jgi:hypothetical protein
VNKNEQLISDLAMIARNAIDKIIDLEKAKQEPVAWEQFHEHMAGPFYKAPRKWVGLTDGETPMLYFDGQLLPFKETKEFVQCVERQLKKKNT